MDILNPKKIWFISGSMGCSREPHLSVQFFFEKMVKIVDWGQPYEKGGVLRLENPGSAPEDDNGLI